MGDESNWREWGAEEVFLFIMGSVDDDSLKEYEEVIRAEVIGAEYSGRDLSDFTMLRQVKEDLGIIKMRPRKAVFRAIQELVQEPEHQPHLADAEGADIEEAPTAYHSK